MRCPPVLDQRAVAVVDARGPSPLSGTTARGETADMSEQSPVWDEMGDRDPLVMDMLEVAVPPSPEEAALHIIGEPSYDDRAFDEVMENLALDE